MALASKGILDSTFSLELLLGKIERCNSSAKIFRLVNIYDARQKMPSKLYEIVDKKKEKES